MSFEELAEELNSSEIQEEGEEIEEQELDEESDIDEDNDVDDDEEEEESESLEDLGEEQKKEKATKDDKKVTIKVNGEEQEDTIENVIRDAQKWRASSNKFQEASKKEKELQNIQGELKKLGDVLQNDPMSIIKQFHGEDGYRKFMEKEIMALIEEENMPADQKEARRIKSIEDKYQRELEERELKIAEYEAEKKYQFYNSIIEKEIAESGLPNNKQMKALYAQKIKAVLPNMSDHEELPMGAITKSIREEMKGSYLSTIKDMTEDDLAEILGEEIVEKVRKSIVKKHSKSTPKTTKAAVQFKSRKEDKKFSWNDAFSEFK